MLEFNYNSLDDEFVTMWSRSKTGEETDMLGKLEKLAENPQFTPADNPALAFCLAKTILTFHSGDEDAHFAYGLLEMLADRHCESIDNIDLDEGDVTWTF